MNEELITRIKRAIFQDHNLSPLFEAQCSEPLRERRNVLLDEIVDLVMRAYQLHLEIQQEELSRQRPN